ncbi:substrate-binding periplasmic protein [Zooshikella harenae]|uniref:Transporter substrate-binding domain-containing protein n=1 Tax=Zooshikella harenae TaxID=2827238 RepID=A0ABS5Z6H9_9GAMM|nr:transporter substrate-binding domain-containing protein [Zooshikella harenae]MBU2709656.1 transporter substrate-binding domain-containing protein [Zooshikella harenae]
MSFNKCSLSVWCWLAFINSLIAFARPLPAETLIMAVGLAIPPYIIKEGDKGMELDIVREILEKEGYTIHLVYLPLVRVVKHIADGTVDAAMTLNQKAGLNNVFLSDSHITYQNAAISLAKHNYHIDSVDDLADKSIVAFQNATLYLGDAFAKMAVNNSRYSEKARQATQVTMLFDKRVDTVVMDINIFKYYRVVEKKYVDTSLPVTIHKIFPPSHYSVAFKSKTARDKFNRGLKALKRSGRYDEIIRQYIPFAVNNRDIQ